MSALSAPCFHGEAAACEMPEVKAKLGVIARQKPTEEPKLEKPPPKRR